MFDFDNEIVDEAYLNAYKQFLLLILSRRELLPFVEVIVNSCAPSFNECYENVHRYVNENKGFSAQYGWLVFVDDEMRYVTFEAHAVIKDNLSQELYEITPTSVKLPFLKSMIWDARFEELVNFLHKKNGNARIKIAR
jgi:hypothetical protein